MQVTISHPPLDQIELPAIVGRGMLEVWRENRSSPALQAVVRSQIERGAENRETASQGAAGYATENRIGFALGAGQLCKELAIDLFEIMLEVEG